MREPDLEDLLDLVGSVYDIALSDDGWDSLLPRLSSLFGGNGAIFFTQDRHASHLDFAHLWGLPHAALVEYQDHFVAVDIGIERHLTLPPGSVTTDESTPASVFRKSEIYNDFRRRWGVERFLAADVFRDARRLAVLSMQGSRHRRPFGTTESRVFERLLPHVRRAIEMRSTLDGARLHQQTLEDVVENLLVGVVLLDERGSVAYANATARRIDERRDGLFIAAERLRATHPEDDRALQRAIAGAMATAKHVDDRGGAALVLRRPVDDRTHAVLVSPGPGVRSASAFRRSAVIVMIGDPDAAIGVGPDLVARLYGLTPAQARLAHAIAIGSTLEEFAQEHGIEVSTARWTMKLVLARTGLRRQADLVRLLLSGPAGVTAAP